MRTQDQVAHALSVGAELRDDVDDVLFQNLTLGGKPLTRDGVKANAFVKNMALRP